MHLTIHPFTQPIKYTRSIYWQLNYVGWLKQKIYNTLVAGLTSFAWLQLTGAETQIQSYSGEGTASKPLHSLHSHTDTRSAITCHPFAATRKWLLFHCVTHYILRRYSNSNIPILVQIFIVRTFFSLFLSLFIFFEARKSWLLVVVFFFAFRFWFAVFFPTTAFRQRDHNFSVLNKSSSKCKMNLAIVSYRCDFVYNKSWLVIYQIVL